ncbi:cholinesterase 1-like [Haliotis rubra]|uniref:cholinesterase 1-like n=1 Tax=Haliotis rubra TaxID=36100 RepID=UPI001EE51273|nr:cholinesterase 1-like [Haliotis rubra]
MRLSVFWSPFLVLGFAPWSVLSAPDVNSTWGQIQGVDKVSKDGLPYFGYYGIPYAKPPTSNLRFRRPEPHPGVADVFNATAYGYACPSLQITNSSLSDEDCLTLNVFLPNSTEVSSQTPVMVWIHGGGFMAGSAEEYEPWKLVTETGVIVVTIQYRLGIFGFISTGNDVAPGNYGLWDQHLALQWIKTNIEAFGGDSNNITIIGESAGAASVAYHVLYPGSKGLFQRAVLQSGAVTPVWGYKRNPVATLMLVARAADCLTEDTDPIALQKLIMNCLRNLTADTLLRASVIHGSMAHNLLFLSWLPTMDGVFIHDEPAKLMSDHTFLSTTVLKDVDVLVGVNNNEGGMMYDIAVMFDRLLNTTYVNEIFRPTPYYTDILPQITNLTLGQHNPVVDDVIGFTYTYPRPDANVSLPHYQVFDTYGDPAFYVPAILFSRVHAMLKTDKKTYLYLFDHYPSFTEDSPVKGMVHGMDIMYLFGQLDRENRNISQEEFKLADNFTAFIGAFAKSSDPNSVLEMQIGTPWPEFDAMSEHYLSFNTNMSIQEHLYSKRASLWLDLVPMLNEAPSPTSPTTTQTSVPTSSPPPECSDDSRVAVIAMGSTLGALVLAFVITIVCFCIKARSSDDQQSFSLY